jgi:hypothetical protein
MSRHFPWDVLGIDPTGDASAVRKAYADALRATNLDEDIAGYAALRRARDEALWLAAQGERGEDEDEGDYGLGGLDDDEVVGELEFHGSGDWDDAPERYDLEPSADAPAPEFTEAQARAQTAWQALLDILYPGGEVSEESVTYAEMEQGLAHLAVLLDHAAEADLAEHDALDGALADVFARTWPRSAPFVEPANAALHWLDEAGQLEERPALVFLNARLKGMRFHDKVQEPDHPLHKAWIELSRPGRAGFVDRMRVKRLDIDKLLTGVRQHYPELESHLAPERVASWEGDANASGVSDTGPKVVRGIFIVLLVVALPRLISAFTDPRAGADPTPPVAEAAAALQAAEADIAVADIFGLGTGMAGVRDADPVFADQLRAALNREDTGGSAALAMVRYKAIGAAEVADLGNLAVRADLRGMWMQAAQRQSPEICAAVMRGNFADAPLNLTEQERDRERALLRQMLEAGLLSHQPKGGETRYAIPGWLVADTLERSGMTEDKLIAALTNLDSPDRCTAEAALIAAVLATSQRVPEDLLRGL